MQSVAERRDWIRQKRDAVDAERRGLDMSRSDRNDSPLGQTFSPPQHDRSPRSGKVTAPFPAGQGFWPEWGEAVVERCRGWSRRGIGPSVVVGVSGGGDSVALLRLLDAAIRAGALDWSLTVAHFHHGLRGSQADAEADAVERLAHALGWPVVVERWSEPPQGIAPAEAPLRAARLEFLARVASHHQARAVVLAHTRDDQAETVLQRVLRGCGPRGLGGIPPRRRLTQGVDLLRPLLEVPRACLRDWLTAIGQPWHDDPTNTDQHRTRAWIRHDLLPRARRHVNPQADAHLARLARHARILCRRLEHDGARLLRTCWRDHLDESTSSEEARVSLDRIRLAAAPRWLRVEALRGLWRARGWPEADMTQRHWRKLARLVETPQERSDHFPGGLRVRVNRNDFVISHPSWTLSPIESRAWDEGGFVVVAPGTTVTPRGRLTIMETTTHSIASDPFLETIDADTLHLPLILRGPRPGERFDPLGMGGSTQPLNDFLRSRDVPRTERSAVVLLSDAMGIVWVVGHRIAHRVRLTSASRRGWRLKWVED